MDLSITSPLGLTPSQTERVRDVITALVYSTPGKVTVGKLNKLLYIAELGYIKKYGERLCPARILHWKHGPYSFDVEEALDILDGDVLSIDRRETGDCGVIRLVQAAKEKTDVALDEETVAFLKEIGETWGTRDYRKELVPFAYATMPFAETPFHQVIDLDRYLPLSDEERAEIDYVPDQEMQRAMDAALNINDKELEPALGLLNA